LGSQSLHMVFPFFILAGCLLLGMGVVSIYGVRQRKIQIWLPAYLRQRISYHWAEMTTSRVFPRHILFCLVDHYEPGWNQADGALRDLRVNEWINRYPEMARNFLDADGYHPRHTWFYPPHYYQEQHLRKLVSLCSQGFGEIELHLHHNRMEPFCDDSASLRKKILDCLELYGRLGIFQTREGGKDAVRYAFIHGDWALDGSRSDYCTILDEITILRETGCYADFTFPAYMMESQPRMVNSLYYCFDDPSRPKSYDRGPRLRAHSIGHGDLVMVQGPLGFRWRGRKHFLIPNVDDGEIAGNNPPNPARVDFWIKQNIHVVGRPEWIIVKAFTHGAPETEHEVLLGGKIREMHGYLSRKYNDGEQYKLHYVTARELYNIIKAAEAGKTGDPGQYRDFQIPGYLYFSQPITANL
jgi:hypothetical protein